MEVCFSKTVVDLDKYRSKAFMEVCFSKTVVDLDKYRSKAFMEVCFSKTVVDLLCFPFYAGVFLCPKSLFVVHLSCVLI